MYQETIGAAVSLAEFSDRLCTSFELPRYPRLYTSRCVPVDALSGNALRRHVLIKAAEKARQDAVQAQRHRVCATDFKGGPHRRTLVIDLEILSKDFEAVGAGQSLGHGILPRPYFRAFLETVRRLFRVVVWTKCSTAWTESVLLVLDPQQKLLPRRILQSELVNCETLAEVLDDGKAVSARDVLIVSFDRHTFGHMANNVLEVEPYRLSYAGHDDLLLQLAALLARHLAADQTTPLDLGGCAAATVLAAGADVLPPSSVPEDLLRLGLHAVRLCASRGPSVGGGAVGANVRHIIPTAGADLLDMPLEFLDDQPSTSGVSQASTSWRHLQLDDMDRPAEEGGRSIRGDLELYTDLDFGPACDAGAAQSTAPAAADAAALPAHQLASGESMASEEDAESAFSGRGAADCSSSVWGSGSLEYLADMDNTATIISVSQKSLVNGPCNNGSVLRAAENTSGSSGTSTQACEAAGAAGHIPGAACVATAGCHGAAKTRQCTPSHAGGRKAQSAVAHFLRKVRCAVTTSAPSQPSVQLQAKQLSAPSGVAADGPAAAVQAGRSSAPAAPLKRLTNLVTRSLRRRSRASGAGESSRHAGLLSPGPCSSGSSYSCAQLERNSANGTSRRSMESPLTAPNVVDRAEAAVRQPATIDGFGGQGCGAMAGPPRAEQSRGLDTHRPVNNRIARLCATAGAGPSVQTAVAAATEGLGDDCGSMSVSAGAVSVSSDIICNIVTARSLDASMPGACHAQSSGALGQVAMVTEIRETGLEKRSLSEPYNVMQDSSRCVSDACGLGRKVDIVRVSLL